MVQNGKHSEVYHYEISRHEYVMSVVPKPLAFKDANRILNSELKSHISKENIKDGGFYMRYDSRRVTSWGLLRRMFLWILTAILSSWSLVVGTETVVLNSFFMAVYYKILLLSSWSQKRFTHLEEPQGWGMGTKETSLRFWFLTQQEA